MIVTYLSVLNTCYYAVLKLGKFSCLQFLLGSELLLDWFVVEKSIAGSPWGGGGVECCNETSILPFRFDSEFLISYFTSVQSYQKLCRMTVFCSAYSPYQPLLIWTSRSEYAGATLKNYLKFGKRHLWSFTLTRRNKYRMCKLFSQARVRSEHSLNEKSGEEMQ